MKNIFNPMSAHSAQQLLPKFSRIVFQDAPAKDHAHYHAEIKSQWIDSPTSAMVHVQIVSYDLDAFRANNPELPGIEHRTRVLIDVTQIIAINKIPRHANPTTVVRQ